MLRLDQSVQKQLPYPGWIPGLDEVKHEDLFTSDIAD